MEQSRAEPKAKTGYHGNVVQHKHNEVKWMSRRCTAVKVQAIQKAIQKNITSMPVLKGLDQTNDNLTLFMYNYQIICGSAVWGQ